MQINMTIPNKFFHILLPEISFSIALDHNLLSGLFFYIAISVIFDNTIKLMSLNDPLSFKFLYGDYAM